MAIALLSTIISTGAQPHGGKLSVPLDTKGDVKVELTTGDPNFASTKGDVKVEPTTGDPNFAFTKGDVKVELTTGDPNFASTKGDVKVELTTGDPNFASSSKFPAVRPYRSPFAAVEKGPVEITLEHQATQQLDRFKTSCELTAQERQETEAYFKGEAAEVLSVIPNAHLAKIKDIRFVNDLRGNHLVRMLLFQDIEGKIPIRDTHIVDTAIEVKNGYFYIARFAPAASRTTWKIIDCVYEPTFPHFHYKGDGPADKSRRSPQRRRSADNRFKPYDQANR